MCVSRGQAPRSDGITLLKHSDDELRQAVGLFRYGLIADLAHLPLGTPGIGERLREKANHAYAIPGTRRTRVAAETIRDWLALYRGGGFEALYPKARVDRGRPRRLPPISPSCSWG